MIIEHDEVKLLPYDPLWKTEFDTVQAGLSQTLNAKGLHPQIIHVGSTAIVDMPAKPIIDILILFSDEQEVIDCVSILTEKGITFLEDGGRNGRYFLVDEAGAFPHHLHVTTQDNQVARDQLRFKSLLQGSDKIMQDYTSVKFQAADAYPDDRTMYRYMKGFFIDAVLRAYELGVQSNDCNGSDGSGKTYADRRSRQLVERRFEDHPIIKSDDCLYVNEPWLIDASLWEMEDPPPEPEDCDDNIRVYIPLDINRDAILRRVDQIINHFGPASENNEMEYESYFGRLLSQVDLYDEYWSAQHRSGVDKHSPETITLVKDIVRKLEDVPDECAESFPACLINELKGKYL